MIMEEKKKNTYKRYFFLKPFLGKPELMSIGLQGNDLCAACQSGLINTGGSF